MADFPVDPMVLAASLAATTILSICYTVVSKLLWSSDLFKGSPMYSWYAGLPLQLILFPWVVYVAYASYAAGAGNELPFMSYQSLVDWMLAKWDDGHPYDASVPMGWLTGEFSALEGPARPAERLFLFLMLGYLTKDTIIPMDTVFIAHHVVCAVFAVSFHLVSPPAIFCAGAMIMEIGSASQGVLYLFPNWLSFLFHAIGMTASNLVAVSLAYIYFDAGVGSLGLRVGFCVVIVVLSGVRQLFCVNNCGEYLSNRGGKSVKAA